MTINVIYYFCNRYKLNNYDTNKRQSLNKQSTLMKKSHFLTIAFAALAMVSCGNKTDNANNTEDSATVEDSTIVSGVPQELQPTVEALISNFNQNVDKNDANALATTLADMQVVYKNLVDEGKLEEAKTYGQAIQKYVSEHASELKAMAEGNNNIPSLVEGVKNLPVSAETTIEEAKQAVISTVVSKASPEIAKGATILNNAQQTAEAVKNAPEAIKDAAETAAENTVNSAIDNAKAKVQAKADNAKAKADNAKAAVEQEKATTKAAYEKGKANAKAIIESGKAQVEAAKALNAKIQKEGKK